jgi:hypothetical protein
MTHLPHGTIVERTPMRDLARRLVEVLFEAGVPASMSARAGLEIRDDGASITSAWDVRVEEGNAPRAHAALAEARRSRRLVVGGCVGRRRLTFAR